MKAKGFVFILIGVVIFLSSSGVDGSSNIFSQISGSPLDVQQGYYPSQTVFYNSQFFAVMSIDDIGSVGTTPQVRRYLLSDQSPGVLEATVSIPLPCASSGCTTNVLFIALNQNLLSGFAVSGSGSSFSGSLFFSINLDTLELATQRVPTSEEQESLGLWGYFPGSGLHTFASATVAASSRSFLASLALSTNFSTTATAQVDSFANILFGATSPSNGNILISGDSTLGGAVLMLNSTLQATSALVPLVGFSLPSGDWPPVASLQNSELVLLTWFLRSPADSSLLSLISLSSPLPKQLSTQGISSGVRLVFGDSENVILVLEGNQGTQLVIENYQIASVNPTKLVLSGSTTLTQTLLLNPVSSSLAQSHSEQYNAANKQFAVITGHFSNWTIYIMQL